MPSPLPLTLTISEEDIQMVERPSCSSKSDFSPIVNITCNLSTTEVNFVDGVRGTICINQCSPDIKNISVGLVQNEEIGKRIAFFLISRASAQFARLPFDFAEEVSCRYCARNDRYRKR